MSKLMPERAGIYAMLILAGVFVSLAILETDRMLSKIYGSVLPDIIVLAAVLLMIVAGISYIMLCTTIIFRGIIT